MKKTIILFVAIVAIASLAPAQAKYFGGANVELYMPSGNFADQAGIGFGGTAVFGKPINENISSYVKVGYIMWGAKKYDLGTYKWEYTWHLIPVKVGGKYYFGAGNMKPYGVLEVGYSVLGAKVKSEYLNPWTNTTITAEATASESRIGFAPGVGMEYKMGEKMALDAQVRYELISDFNNIGIQVGLKFDI